MKKDNFVMPVERKDKLKQEFLMCRIERPLFLLLKNKADNEGRSFSDIIRQGVISTLETSENHSYLLSNSITRNKTQNGRK